MMQRGLAPSHAFDSCVLLSLSCSCCIEQSFLGGELQFQSALSNSLNPHVHTHTDCPADIKGTRSTRLSAFHFLPFITARHFTTLSVPSSSSYENMLLSHGCFTFVTLIADYS